MGKRVKLRFHFQGSAQRRAFFVSFSSQIVVSTYYIAVITKRDPFRKLLQDYSFYLRQNFLTLKLLAIAAIHRFTALTVAPYFLNTLIFSS